MRRLEESRAGRAVVRGFIVLWLGLQLAVPLVRKFELPSLRYRQVTFSWGMFSLDTTVYRVRLVRENAGGRRHPVRSAGRFAPELARCGRVVLDPYHPPRVLEARYARLLAHVATRQRDGQRYHLAFRWRTSTDRGRWAASRRAPTW